MKKINWKLIGIVLLWVLGLGTVISSMAFTEVQQRKVLCKSVHININREDENYFINAEDVRRILFSAGDSLVGTGVDKIPVSLLELLIRKNKYVKDAEVYIDVNGNLFVNVQQRKPLIRILNLQNISYYIDEDGYKMPLSTLYSARVLVANGNIEEEYDVINDTIKTQKLKDLHFLAELVRKDVFWDAQIEQVYIEQNNDIVLIPRLGDHKIVLGDTSRITEKFDNLMVFYKKALPKVGWETYHTISVKYKGQVVCTRRDAKINVLPQTLDSTAINTIDTVSNSIEQKN
jgi:cell division protein FtsQ